MAAKKTEGKAGKTVGSFDKFKEFDGRAYTGMGVGRSHKWNYDAGVWRDHKITPDLWSISYAVTKRRAGHAPQDSGASVGTDYHWVMLVHQHVEKLNADDYSTAMTGLKFRLAHKRAGKDKWNTSAGTQRKHLVGFLRQMIAQLEQEPVELEFEAGGTHYEGEALPILGTEADGEYREFEVTLNNKNYGIIRHMKSGWKLDLVDDAKFIRELGKAIEAAISPNPII